MRVQPAVAEGRWTRRTRLAAQADLGGDLTGDLRQAGMRGTAAWLDDTIIGKADSLVVRPGVA